MNFLKTLSQSGLNFIDTKIIFPEHSYAYISFLAVLIAMVAITFAVIAYASHKMQFDQDSLQSTHFTSPESRDRGVKP